MSWVAVGVGGATLVGSAIASEKAADASKQASGQIQGNIKEGVALSDAAQLKAESELQGGQQSALAQYLMAQNSLQRGAGQQQGFLGQAGNMFKGASGLVNPAIQNLQQTSTAGGRSSALQSILSDPNNAALFGELDRQRMNQASDLGIRRSGANLAMGDNQRFNMANQLLANQDVSQQNLLSTGLGGQSALANILSQQGGVAGAGGMNMAGLQQNTGQLYQQGGINMSGLTQQGAANQMNLLGQLGQAQAAGTMGASNANAQMQGNILNAGATMGSAYLNRPQYPANKGVV